MGNKSTIHTVDSFRLKRAVEQKELRPRPKEEVIKYTIEFLNIIGIDTTKIPWEEVKTKMGEACKLKMKVNDEYVEDRKYYEYIQKRHNLKIPRRGDYTDLDIVWMKFTKEREGSGFLGVVAAGADINFDIPPSEKCYNETSDGKPKTNANNWKYNTSGIIIDSLGKKWDEDSILVFPLEGIDTLELTRGDIECGIGNYLIDKGVPILDYYSHRF